MKTYRTIILPIPVYWCETWSLTLSAEHRLSVFENIVMRKMFVPGGTVNKGVEKTT
jgi:hypothetical protein